MVTVAVDTQKTPKMNTELESQMQIHDNPALKAEARNLNFFYGEAKALKGINMPIYDKKVTALIGPSGCGKSTYLRSFNRMHDLYPGNRYEGEIRFFPDNTNLPELRPTKVVSCIFRNYDIGELQPKALSKTIKGRSRIVN